VPVPGREFSPIKLPITYDSVATSG
jgi:hypothetical protein